MQRIIKIPKRHLQKLVLKTCAERNLGNDRNHETQTQKFLIPARKPNRFDH